MFDVHIAASRTDSAHVHAVPGLGTGGFACLALLMFGQSGHVSGIVAPGPVQKRMLLKH